MAKAIVTLKVMPESPEVDLEALKTFCEEHVNDFANPDEYRVKEDPVAFGLKALIIQFAMEENVGSTDALEETINEHSDVKSAETTDVRRALG